MADNVPQQFENVSVVSKANVYFNGGVVSHTILLKDGSRKTLGLIFPGSYKFNTDAPERMDMIAGSCKVKLAGQTDWKTYSAGTFFLVPGKSAFEVSVESGVAEYLCSFL
ncbi:MAG TPA: pyrimidine/purine nucleoside phosphorylase [Planctomycetota bacterium]|nr:pyrimidine/purine nucleoside phosphorylase [Planctomycetota bacterium]